MGLTLAIGLVVLTPVTAQFGSGVELVEVYATVTDRRGGPVTGLAASDFRVREDGLPQRIETFAEGAFPLTVVLGIDRSWSMAGRPLELAARASESFLRRLRPMDESTVLAIGTDAEELAPMSADRQAQVAAVRSVRPWGTTALRDWLVSAFDRVEGRQGRQAIVLFSDGEDRYSRVPEVEVLDRARRSRALVYPVMIGGDGGRWLGEVAAVTGGRFVVVRNAGALEGALTGIAEELRHQYLLGYVPERAEPTGDRGWRRIQAEVPGRPGLIVRARDGYGSGPVREPRH
jgi:Ca-activated chloride channel family protein